MSLRCMVVLCDFITVLSAFNTSQFVYVEKILTHKIVMCNSDILTNSFCHAEQQQVAQIVL